MQRVKATDFSTRVYQYGAVPLDKFPEEGVEELYRGNNLWNNLVALHNKHREKREKARCDADGEYALITESIKELELEIERAKEDKRNARNKVNTKDPSHPLIREANEKIEFLQDKRRKLRQSAKPARKRADGIIDKKALNKAFRDAVNTAQRVESTGGLDSRIANQVADYFRTARDRAFKDNAKLRPHGFKGTGFFFYRFRRKGAKTDGVTFRELFARGKGDHRPFVFLGTDSTRKKPRLRLRIKFMSGRKRSDWSYVHFDLILHRPIPEGAQVQNGKLVRKRVGDKFSYTVSLTVREPNPSSGRIKKKAIGVDIGFRQTADGTIRAAAIASSDAGEPVQYVDLPEVFLRRKEHIDNLKSKMDEAATQLGEIIKPLLKAGSVLPEDHKKYRLVKSIARMPPNVTLSFEKAYKLGAWVAKHGRGELPEQVEREAVRWWSANSRMYRESHNLRHKNFLDRKALYRQIAANLVGKRQPIGVEIIDLRVFAETRDSDNPLGNTARSNRFLVSPSEFLNAIKNAGQREGVPVIKVPPQNTSKTCSACGKIHRELGAEPAWTCPGCGRNHDRDHNAAINIARRAEEYLEKK